MLTRRAAALGVGAALALAGCGQSSTPGAQSATSKIDATVSALHTAFAKRDAVAACAQLTPTYWQALRQELLPRLEAVGVSLPGTDCVADLQHVFHEQPAGTVTLPNFHVSHLAVHGTTATASLALSGPGSQSRFVEDSTGRWRLDCCAGAQSERQTLATYRVTSPAMSPTLRTGEIVTSDNAALRGRSPAVGDIVAFHPPPNLEACADRHEGVGHPRPCGAPANHPSTQVFIKRIVGLPGDHIAIMDGHVVRNGAAAHEPFATACPNAHDDACTFPRPIVVPAGAYFVLGDNRPASDDSREWGPVPKAWLIGLIRP
jgi:signal peptidase I